MNTEEKLEKALEALHAIKKSCPIIGADKDGMYNERATNLFLRSTVRRMELAGEAIKEIEDDG